MGGCHGRQGVSGRCGQDRNTCGTEGESRGQPGLGSAARCTKRKRAGPPPCSPRPGLPGAARGAMSAPGRGGPPTTPRSPGRSHPSPAWPTGPSGGTRAAGTYPDDRGYRRGQGNGVVGVDDALSEAENQARDHEPPTPNDERCAGAVGTGPSAGSSPSQRQAGPVPPAKARRFWLPISEPNRRVRPVGAQRPLVPSAAADAASLVAGEPAEPVVPED